MTFNDDGHFTLANIPFGIASRKGEDAPRQSVTRLRNRVYFLPELITAGQLKVDKDTKTALKQVGI
jgi:hypothetical protein